MKPDKSLTGVTRSTTPNSEPFDLVACCRRIRYSIQANDAALAIDLLRELETELGGDDD